MGLEISGQKKSGGVTQATFSKSGRLLIDAEVNQAGHFVSLDDERAFNINSEDPAAAAGDFICYFQNTSKDRDFFVDIVRVSAQNASKFRVHQVTGTPGGTEITPVNMNLRSGVTAEGTAYGDQAVTGLTSSSIFAADRVPADSSSIIPFDDVLILGTDDAIAIEYESGTTGEAEALIRGYFQNR